jgi:hypothetical protein
MKELYLVVASSGSKYNHGHGKINLLLVTEEQIISAAEQQAMRRGEGLTAYTDIEWVGINPDEDGDYDDYKMSRDWRDGEILLAAVSEFTNDGYFYKIFKYGDKAELKDFIECAQSFGMGDEAERLAL